MSDELPGPRFAVGQFIEDVRDPGICGVITSIATLHDRQGFICYLYTLQRRGHEKEQDISELYARLCEPRPYRVELRRIATVYDIGDGEGQP